MSWPSVNAQKGSRRGDPLRPRGSVRLSHQDLTGIEHAVREQSLLSPSFHASEASACSCGAGDLSDVALPLALARAAAKASVTGVLVSYFWK